MTDIIHNPSWEIEGITGWYWPTKDQQTWDIIKHDWVTSHQHVIDALFNGARQTRVAVQAGGNCGMYPRLLSSRFKNVYTFEPDPLNFFALNLNCAVDSVIKMQAAVGQHNGFVSMVHRYSGNVGMHQVISNAESTIPQLALDTFDFADVDLLWLDIEDYELNALRGAVDTISRCRPVIMCENPTTDVKAFFDENEYELVQKSAMDGVFLPRK